MKTLSIKVTLISLLLLSIFSCKKPFDPENYVEGWTRVIGVKATDTSSTPFMQARTETVGLIIVQDAMLKAELMSYSPLPNGMGQYIVRMTNKQPCQVILRWMWEGLTLDSWTPSNDVLTANQVVEFTLIGDAKPGRIKVKAEKSNSDCSNSSTLILEITNSLLPIEFTSCRTYRKGSNMHVDFSTEEPQNVDDFYVMWSPDGRKEHEKVVAFGVSDHKTKKYSLTYPAIKKEDLK